MFERLAKEGREFEEKTLEHVHEYADAGLRTLILAYRELDENQYKEFDDKFSQAKNSVSEDREAMIEEISDKIERNLILLGATAVEDKLQEGVSKENKMVTYKYMTLGTGLEMMLLTFFYRFLIALTSLPKLE